MENDLNVLRRKWIETTSFQDEQTYLSALVREGGAQLVGLDPDGTLPPWLAVVVRRETGVVYATQCAGVSTEQRLIEGYLVPLGGAKYEPNGNNIEIAPLTDAFHQHDTCMWNWKGHDLPEDRLRFLTAFVGQIPYWHCSLEGHDQPHPLRLDKARVADLAEAWIPVEIPDGLGVLVYKNCD